ncbi:MAG: hypothetical protein FWE44_01940 [Defluviitaleaceae bacterium]|nr:hypothetical protein [Defluviitaleaceae bacterium]
MSNHHQHIFKIVTAGLLIAIGIIIPLFSPLQLVIEPASYTLGVHVPIFIAMFISPKVAIGVALGTTLGFFLRGLPITIVLRAASHIFYAGIGAYYLSKVDKFNLGFVKLRAFSLAMALIHAVAETAAVLGFYIATGFPANQGALWVFGFIGLGTIIHSMVDFEIANIIRLPLQKQRHFRQISQP